MKVYGELLDLQLEVLCRGKEVNIEYGITKTNKNAIKDIRVYHVVAEMCGQFKW